MGKVSLGEACCCDDGDNDGDDDGGDVRSGSGMSVVAVGYCDAALTSSCVSDQEERKQ